MARVMALGCRWWFGWGVFCATNDAYKKAQETYLAPDDLPALPHVRSALLVLAMPRALHIPGVIFLFCAFVLLFLVSISLPFITALDFVRIHFKDGNPTTTNTNALNELRVRTAYTLP